MRSILLMSFLLLNLVGFATSAKDNGSDAEATLFRPSLHAIGNIEGKKFITYVESSTGPQGQRLNIKFFDVAQNKSHDLFTMTESFRTDHSGVNTWVLAALLEDALNNNRVSPDEVIAMASINPHPLTLTDLQELDSGKNILGEYGSRYKVFVIKKEGEKGWYSNIMAARINASDLTQTGQNKVFAILQTAREFTAENIAAAIEHALNNKKIPLEKIKWELTFGRNWPRTFADLAVLDPGHKILDLKIIAGGACATTLKTMAQVQ